jgi:hypothetical protein
MAYKLQTAGPELLDFSKESAATREMYGLDKEDTRAFSTNCLLARRMVERGVRFVMLMHASWDHHSGIVSGLKKQCGATGGSGQHRPRPSPERLLTVDGRRRHSRRSGDRQDR